MSAPARMAGQAGSFGACAYAKSPKILSEGAIHLCPNASSSEGDCRGRGGRQEPPLHRLGAGPNGHVRGEAT